ncbi:signal peptidase I [Paenibacillus silviterrae]|uniref:signal peptidase I n=1 Tax=Paenibacillus silviterrae TaxID=3242194 RepID=UPI0025434348|nr:signal peptidase I [Paenibacillus chinjuensis]
MSAPLSDGAKPKTPKTEDQAEPGLLLEVWDWIKAVVVAMTVIILLHQYGFHLSTVKGASMEPTLTEGEWLFINKTIQYLGTPERGDIVVVRDPSGMDSPHPYLVKRVVAVGGDEVQIIRGKLLVNGAEVKESYIDSPIEDGRFEPLTVMEGTVFVMGDNRHRSASHDSRSFGPVPVGQIEGRAEWIVWPLAKWSRL